MVNEISFMKKIMLCFALQICNIKIDFTSVISPFFQSLKTATAIKKGET